MGNSKVVRYLGTEYQRAEFSSVGEFLITADSPRSEEEWKQFSQDLYAFYKGQVDAMTDFDEASAMLQTVGEDLRTLQDLYRKAESSFDIRTLRDLMQMATTLLNKDMKQLVPALQEQYKKLVSIKKAKQAHDKIKKQISSMPQRGMNKWF